MPITFCDRGDGGALGHYARLRLLGERGSRVCEHVLFFLVGMFVWS